MLPDDDTDTDYESTYRDLEGMAKLGKHIVCAGGLTDEQGKLKGSVVIDDFDDEADVKSTSPTNPT